MPQISIDLRRGYPCALHAACVVAAMASWAPAQQLFIIPPAWDDTTSAVAAISADGATVVGTTSRPTPFRRRAFVCDWHQSLTPTVLPTLAAGQSSAATSVSCDGSIIGGQSGSQAVLWTGGQAMAAGFLAGPTVPQRSSVVHAISCDGTLIAGQATNSAGSLEGYFANRAGDVVGPMIGIGFVTPTGQTDSSVNALTGDGRLVGRASWSIGASSGFAQFIVAPGAAVAPIGLSDGFAIDDSANAVTPDGSVIVGGVTVLDSFGGMYLVPSRTVDGVLSVLAPCAEGSGSATGVSADGRVMVGFADCLGPNRAFVWDPVNGYRLIEDILRDAGALPVGYSLTIATGISADGTVIVGNGTGPGYAPRGWVAVIPRTDGPSCWDCPADFNNDGGVDGADLARFFEAYESGGECADTNTDGGIDGGDLARFFEAYESGGCSDLRNGSK